MVTTFESTHDRVYWDSSEPRIPDELYVEPRWYACYTWPRHEKRAAGLLRKRGIDSFLPEIPRRRRWKDRVATVSWPMFPGYVFGRFTLRDYHAVLTTPGIATVVRGNGYPAPVRDAELENVRRLARILAQTGMEPPTRPMLSRGDWVRIDGGPFHGIEGIVLELRGRRRVLVGITTVGCGVEISVPIRALRRIPQPL